MKIVLMLSIAFSIFTVGESTLCYSCSACKEPFDLKAASRINCSVLSGDVCRKEIMEFSSGRELYYRGCPDWKSISEDTKNIVSSHAFFCRGDFCNDAQSFSPALGLMMMTMISVISFAWIIR